MNTCHCITFGTSLQLSALQQMFSASHSLALHRGSNILIEDYVLYVPLLTSGALLHKALPLTNSSYLSSLNSLPIQLSDTGSAQDPSLLFNSESVQAERHSEPRVPFVGFPFSKDWYCL